MDDDDNEILEYCGNMKRRKRTPRPSPMASASEHEIGEELYGGDGNIWVVMPFKRMGRSYKRWVRKAAIDESLKYPEDTVSVRPPSEAEPKSTDKKEKSMEESEIEDMDELEVNPSEKEMVEDEPEPEPEVVIPTLISKLRSSVTMPEEFKFPDAMIYYKMLRNVRRNKWILCTGPSGCGKTSLGKILADITGKQFFAFNFGDTMNPSAKLLGDTKFDKDTGTWFKESRFVKAIQTKNAFILLDEITRDRTGDLQNLLMPVLDGQAYLALDESDDADMVPVADNVFFYATANVGREYLGANASIDRAWMDRFTSGMFELDYLPLDKEIELLLHRTPGLIENDARKICEFAQKIRQLYAAEELSSAVSTRMTLAAGSFLMDGLNMIDALLQVSLPFYPIQGSDDSERIKVKQAIQAME
jgi:nitric oxide reductase NorQ protein